MKNLLIVIVFFSCIAYSCIIDHSTLTRFHVQNQSGRDLSLDFYNTDLDGWGIEKDTTIFIPHNSAFMHEYHLKGEESPVYRPFGPSTDSVIIRFDVDVRIIYRQPLRFPNAGNRNILSIDSYTGGRKRRGLYEYFYTITEQDYLDALAKYRAGILLQGRRNSFGTPDEPEAFNIIVVAGMLRLTDSFCRIN